MKPSKYRRIAGALALVAGTAVVTLLVLRPSPSAAECAAHDFSVDRGKLGLTAGNEDVEGERRCRAAGCYAVMQEKPPASNFQQRLANDLDTVDVYRCLTRQDARAMQK